MRKGIQAAGCVVAAAFALGAAPARAGDVDTRVPFQLDHWYELNASEGPVTLHRIRIVRQSGSFTKSTLFRPGHTDFSASVQIQIEFSNSAKRDWKADLDIEWLDAGGATIDGYKGSEGLDSEQDHDKVTVTLSTLEYGLGKAKTLKVSISSEPD